VRWRNASLLSLIHTGRAQLTNHSTLSTMSSLHSCHWDWCRFTTVLHEDFVQHVISAHIDKAEPIKRGDISLIRQVEQGTSSHSTSGEPRLAVSSLSHIDTFIGGFLSSVATSARSEAPQSVSQPVVFTGSPQPAPLPFLSPHYQHVSRADHPLLPKPANAQTMNHPLSFVSGSTYILPDSPQKQQTTASDSEVSRPSCFIFNHLASHGVNVLSGTEPGNFTVRTTNTGSIQIPEFRIANPI
jgi:hypothetical protein